MKSLLVNEAETRKFLERMLPKLKDDEVFVILSFARKKYHPSATDEWMLYRDIIKDNDIDKMIHKIKRNYSYTEGFNDLRTGEPINKDAFVCYIDLSPKSMLKAYNMFIKKMNDILYQVIKNKEQSILMRKMKNYLMSCIHKSNSYKPYLLLDVDTKNSDLLNSILNALESWEWISETRGGYHVLVKKTKQNCQFIFQNLQFSKGYCDYDIEIKSNVMTPIPGTLQGGFEVKQFDILTEKE